jgi:quinol monooxygenase YgiN
MSKVSEDNIHIIARFQIKDKKVEESLLELKKVVKLVRAEKGCLLY